MRRRAAAPGKQQSNGVRVSIGGPLRGDGHRIRLVFGIAGVGEGAAARRCAPMSPCCSKANSRIFATQGDDKCTVDSLTQERVEVLGPGTAVYRVVARGFCIGPATSLTRDERVVITSFDFAGRVEFSDDDRRAMHPCESSQILRRRVAAWCCVLALSCAGRRRTRRSAPLEDLAAFPSGKLTISDGERRVQAHVSPCGSRTRRSARPRA